MRTTPLLHELALTSQLALAARQASAVATARLIAAQCDPAKRGGRPDADDDEGQAISPVRTRSAAPAAGFDQRAEDRSLSDLASDGHGTVWGVGNVKLTGQAALFTMDPATGAARFARAISGVANPLHIHALAIDPTSGAIYGATGASPASACLYRIDTASGAAARVGDSGVSRIASLAIDMHGRMYGLSGADAGEPVLLLQFDLGNGEARVVGVLGSALNGGELAFRPEDNRLFVSAELGFGNGLWAVDPDTAAATLAGYYDFNFTPAPRSAGLSDLAPPECEASAWAMMFVSAASLALTRRRCGGRRPQSPR